MSNWEISYEQALHLKARLRQISSKNVLRAVVDVFNIKRIAGYIGYLKTDHYSTEADTLEAAIVKMRDLHHQIITSPQAINATKAHEEAEISFSAWLAKQKNRDTPLGDLAIKRGFADKSEGWPIYSSLKEYQDYLTSNHPPRGSMATLVRAWKSYQSYLQKKQLSSPKKQAKKIVSKKDETRTVVSVKKAISLLYGKRTIEKFSPGDAAWISWDGKKAIPVSVLEVDERHYSVKIVSPPKKAGNRHSLFWDEVRSTPELACENLVTL